MLIVYLYTPCTVKIKTTHARYVYQLASEVYRSRTRHVTTSVKYPNKYFDIPMKSDSHVIMGGLSPNEITRQFGARKKVNESTPSYITGHFALTCRYIFG